MSDSAEPTIAAHPRGLAQVVIRGVGLAGAGYGASQIITFGSYLVLAKLLTPTAFGIFAAASTIVGVGTLVGESGMLAALIHRHDRLEEAFNSALLATAGGGLALTVLGVATAPLVGLYFHSHTATLVAASLAGTIFLRLISIVPDARLQRRFSFKRRVIVDPLSVIAGVGGSIAGAASGLGVWSLVIGGYSSGVTAAVASWALAGWRPHPRTASLAMWRELARYGRPVVGAEFIRRATLEVPVLALGRFSGSAALGQFSYAFRVGKQPLEAMTNVGSYVLLPALARIAPDKERFHAAVLRSLRWVCGVNFPVAMLLVPLGTPAVVLLFGEKWREAGHGTMALAGYCAALVIDSIASEAWKARGRPDMLPRMHGLALALTVVCVAVLTTFGVIGVTIAMSLSALGVATYALWGMHTALGIPLADMGRAVTAPAFASIAMAGVMFLVEHFLVKADHRGVALGLLLVAGEAILGLAFYLVTVSLISRRMRGELLAAARRVAGRGRLASS